MVASSAAFSRMWTTSSLDLGCAFLFRTDMRDWFLNGPLRTYQSEKTSFEEYKHSISICFVHLNGRQECGMVEVLVFRE